MSHCVAFSDYKSKFTAHMIKFCITLIFVVSVWQHSRNRTEKQMNNRTRFLWFCIWMGDEKKNCIFFRNELRMFCHIVCTSFFPFVTIKRHNNFLQTNLLNAYPAEVAVVLVDMPQNAASFSPLIYEQQATWADYKLFFLAHEWKKIKLR